MELKLAESKRKEAQAAVDEAAETGGKKKAKGAPSDEELQEELMACNEASAKLQERTDDAKRVMDAASTELQAAKAELEAKEKLERVTALETRLRSIHLNTTGRVLPCRLPGLLDEAHQQVICHPEQIFMKSDDLKAMMEAISFEQGLTRQERLALRESTKSLNVIFRRLVQQQTDMAEARLADSTLTPKQQLEVAKQLELQKRRHKQGLVSYEVVRLHCGLNPPSPRPLRAQQRPASAMELRRPGDVSTQGIAQHRHGRSRDTLYRGEGGSLLYVLFLSLHISSCYGIQTQNDRVDTRLRIVRSRLTPLTAKRNLISKLLPLRAKSARASASLAPLGDVTLCTVRNHATDNLLSGVDSAVPVPYWWSYKHM